MLFQTNLVNMIMFLYLIDSQVQINFQHNCLYIPVAYLKVYDERQILPFCLSELPSKFHIKPNQIDPIYSFNELKEKNITAEHLYQWSATIDLIEQYQFYLNDPQSLLENETFYNCTLPYFGSECQYIFKDLNYSKSSLVKMIEEYYYMNLYEPMLFTCYEHLKCNRGFNPACLDWTEICDGKIDCFDEGLDEEDCWQLEIVDRCDINQYQCHNGQCIPNMFKDEHEFSFDCIDQSDESLVNRRIIRSGDQLVEEPIFMLEDVSCVNFVGTNHGWSDTWTSSCVKHRQKLISYSMFSVKPNSLSEECWTALKCIVYIPINDSPICKLVCLDGFCNKLLKTQCPDLIYLSAIPFLYRHVNLVVDKNHVTFDDWDYKPLIKFICFDHQQLHVDDRYMNFYSLNNQTCFNDTYSILSGYIENYHWSEIYFYELLKWLNENSVSLKSNLSIYTNSNLYECENWPKIIPNRRVNDWINDCLYQDDEKRDSTLYQCSQNNSKNDFLCVSYDLICIPASGVNDGKCDCPFEFIEQHCDDEDGTIFDQSYTSLFQQICDKSKDIRNPAAGGRDGITLDEANCEHWPSVHIYNHCDGYFDIDKGLDELNCDRSPPMICPSNHHLCISQNTHQFICLPSDKINNGIIDCVGAFDEPSYCHKHLTDFKPDPFCCQNNNRRRCIPAYLLCQSESFCLTNDYEKVCRLNDNDYILKTPMNTYNQSNCSEFAQFICKQYTNLKYREKKYFTLDQQMNFTDEQSTKIENFDKTGEFELLLGELYHQRCHRGLDLIIYLDKEKNRTRNICLCPPSYYGSQCQYQNQRISLTLQFRASSDSIQIPFIIIISLIDNSQERMIHSTEQVTYLSSKHCQTKFHFYLLYSTRPKDLSKEYFLHIDIYEKITLKYRASFIQQIQFPFLAVHRLSQILTIPYQRNSIESCSDKQCEHGQCIRYANDMTNQSFCQCDRGWRGETCSIEYDCQCSVNAVCLGQMMNNRSICICPLHRKGPKCLIEDKICGNQTCSNRGQCVSLDEYEKEFICICENDDTVGEFCQFNGAKLVISFHENIQLPSTVLIHFIEIKMKSEPRNTKIIKTIYPGQQSLSIRWSLPFHLVFTQFDNQTFYLTLIQKNYQPSSIIGKTVEESDRCLHIRDLFNQTIVNSPIVHRIKYYHLPCQRSELDLRCFYDNYQLCFCQEVVGYRVANCFDFNSTKKSICTGFNACKNDGICYQEDTTCSRLSICQCQPCFYGAQCDITTNSFNLSLDAILAFAISPNLSLKKQSSTVVICLCITIILVCLGFINACLSLITFKDPRTRKSGCGVYLLSSSILNFCILILFLLKFLIVLSSQIGRIKNYSFLTIQCYSMDFLLRCCLNIEQWLTAFVAIERAVTSIQGVNFRQQKAKLYSKWIIICSIFFVILTNIHDPFFRRLFQENDDEQQQRYWCIVEYQSTFLYIYNSLIAIFHFILPFIINFISAIIIIFIKTKKELIMQRKKQESHLKKVLIEQIQRHQNLLIAPCILTILGIPRLIMSFTSSCMTSKKDFWFYLLGYYISLIPSLLTFIIFVLPSSTYKQAFRTAMSQLFR